MSNATKFMSKGKKSYVLLHLRFRYGELEFVEKMVHEINDIYDDDDAWDFGCRTARDYYSDNKATGVEGEYGSLSGVTVSVDVACLLSKKDYEVLKKHL